MKLQLLLFCLLLLIFSCSTGTSEPDKFIKVEDGKFVQASKPYIIIGTNYWYGSNISSKGKEGQRERLTHELDYLKSLGINNLRVQACSEGGEELRYSLKPTLQTKMGVYNEKLFDGLDFFLNECAKRQITVVLVLNNYWSWTGGMTKYLEWCGAGKIPYPSDDVPDSWSLFMKFSDQFYVNDSAMSAFQKHIKVMLNRKNNYSGIIYKNDPTIMAWQLANEPRGGKGPKDREALINWIHATSAFIKTFDKNHLVTTGSEGSVGHHWDLDDYEKANNCASIDYLTYHLWIQNWSWFDPLKPNSTIDTAIHNAEKYIDDHERIAKKLNKPAVLEEFGVARDNGNFVAGSSALYRNRFFKWVFDKTAKMLKSGAKTSGTNFWGWSGEGNANHPGGLWQPGDDYIGDPPHEIQGWYAIYESDSATVSIIRNYCNTMKEIELK
jgi:mannan endo-1,4-beta-mannosidase